MVSALSPPRWKSGTFQDVERPTMGRHVSVPEDQP
jgi:hypothetical protein